MSIALSQLPVFVIFLVLHSLFLQTFASIGQKGNHAIPVWSSLLLHGGAVDPCLKLPTLTERGECLQSVIELYYGTSFTKSCPSFGINLAFLGCTGCPWEKINKTAISAALGPSQTPNNMAPYFHLPLASCSIADHVMPYTEWKRVYMNIGYIGLIAGLMVIIISAPGEYMPGRVYTVGKPLPEPMYLGLLWVIVNIVNVALSVSEDYFLFCESVSSFFAQGQIRVIADASVLALSFLRCLRLSSNSERHGPAPLRQKGVPLPGKTSWYHYAMEKSTNPASRLRRTAVRFMLVAMPGVLVFTYITDLSEIFQIGNPTLFSLCRAGYKDVAMGFIQYSKCSLEILAVVVYALGPQQGKLRFWMRYVTLVAIMLSSWVVLALMLPTNGYYKQEGVSMLVPYVSDNYVAGHFTEITHINFVALLGLLEPLRLGWPQGPKQDKAGEGLFYNDAGWN